MSLGIYNPGRLRPLASVCLALGGAAGLMAVAGCRHDSAPAAAPVAASPSVNVQPANFQPYTVLSTPPPAPAVVTRVHQKLHLIRTHNHAALADASGRVYDVGRDASGHIYPVYKSPSDGRTYPLYYDVHRDRYYRVAQDDQGHFMRGYADDPDTQYYSDDQDYEDYAPSVDERPIITNYNTNNYYNDTPSDYNDYDPGYRNYGYPVVSAPHHHGHQDDWLWAIPVIAAAYFLLRPHHSSPPPPYYGQRYAYARPIAGRSITEINSNNRTINNTVINQVNNYGAPYRPWSQTPRPLVAAGGAAVVAAAAFGAGAHHPVWLHRRPAGASPQQPWPSHLASAPHVPPAHLASGPHIPPPHLASAPHVPAAHPASRPVLATSQIFAHHVAAKPLTPQPVHSHPALTAPRPVGPSANVRTGKPAARPLWKTAARPGPAPVRHAAKPLIRPVSHVAVRPAPVRSIAHSAPFHTPARPAVVHTAVHPAVRPAPVYHAARPAVAKPFSRPVSARPLVRPAPVTHAERVNAPAPTRWVKTVRPAAPPRPPVAAPRPLEPRREVAHTEVRPAAPPRPPVETRRVEARPAPVVKRPDAPKLQ